MDSKTISMKPLYVLLFVSSFCFSQQSDPNFLKGFEELMNEKPEKALKSFSKVLRKDPKNAKALMFTGSIKAVLGMNNDALIDLDRSIALDPQIAETYHYRSLVCYSNNQIKDAIADVSKAIQLDPLNTGYVYNRAKFYIETGNYEGAIKDGEYMLSLDQVASNPYILHCMAEAYAGLGLYNAALAKADEFIEIDGRTAGYVLRGDIYYQMENYAFAANDYEQFLNDENANTFKGEAYLKAGNTYLRMKKNERACVLFQSALTSGMTVGDSLLQLCH